MADAVAAIDFFVRVFGAHETFCLEDAGECVGHAELRFRSATVMISDEHPEHGVLAPPAHGASGVTLHLHVDDVYQLARRAVDALWSAADDRVLPAPDYADAVRDALPTPPEYRLVHGAGHFDFLAPCDSGMADRTPTICVPAPGFDRVAFHAEFNRVVVRFFEEALVRP